MLTPSRAGTQLLSAPETSRGSCEVAPLPPALGRGGTDTSDSDRSHPSRLSQVVWSSWHSGRKDIIVQPLEHSEVQALRRRPPLRQRLRQGNGGDAHRDDLVLG
jgi:hypothetical protein